MVSLCTRAYRAISRAVQSSQSAMADGYLQPVCELLEPRRLLADASPAIELFDAAPAVFVENQGQWSDASIYYAYNMGDASIAFGDDGLRFRLTSVGSSSFSLSSPDALTDPLVPPVSESTSLSMQFVGANTVIPQGEEKADGVYNYFIGEQARWRSNVSGYQTISYDNLYDGVTLKTFGQKGSLKYEFHVAPGVDYQQVQIRYDGIEGLSIAADGSLHVQTALGEMVDDAPVIYQEIAGERVEVAGKFVLLDESTCAFEVTGQWDNRYELVLDPELAWSSYLGGSYEDYGNGIAVDDAGNAWVTGIFNTSDNSGALVAKINADGTLAWSSSLGGFCGHGIAIDSSGNVFVTGEDGFVTKIKADGTLAWSCDLGSSGLGIAVDDSGNAWVTGTIGRSSWISGGFDTSFNGGFDAFVAKINANGTVAWSSYLGGSGDDRGASIAVDGSGNAWVTGTTESPGWAVRGFDTSFNSGDYFSDAFVAKINADGTLAWSSYLGGSDDDSGNGIAVDSSGNAWVTGATSSSGWTSGGFDTVYNDGGVAFVAKINVNGTLAWSSYLGGSNYDEGHSIAIDGSGNAWVTGVTHSSGWTSGGFDTSFNGYYADAFVAKINAGGTLAWSSYLGGSSDDSGDGIAVDASGNVWVTGSTGYTGSEGWASGGFDTSYNGGSYDGFVAKIDPAGTADNGTPMPYTSTWATVPYATGLTSIRMVAATASDPSGVQYYFKCLTSGGHDSGWQDSPIYEDTGLHSYTVYSYQVQTRDKSANRNTGGWSAAMTAGGVFNIERVGALGGAMNDVEVVGNLAYVATGLGLSILDVSNPTGPSEVGQISLPSAALDVSVAGSYAYVAAGDSLQIINISNPASPTVTKAYTAIGAEAVAIAGSYAYVADDSGLHIVRITNPASPVLVGACNTPSRAMGVSISGSYAYVTVNSGYGLYVINISNPAVPVLTGVCDVSGWSEDVAVAGSYAYVVTAFSATELQIVDISNPAAPILAGSYGTAPPAAGIAVVGSYAYLVDAGGLQIINVSNPAAVTLVGSYAGVGPSDICVLGSHAYARGGGGSLQILDISNPAAVTPVGRSSILSVAASVTASGSYAYVTGGGSVYLVDVSDAASPRVVSVHETPGYAVGAIAVGAYAYIADYTSGLQILNISNPAAPTLVGSFDTPGFALDVAVVGIYAYIADSDRGLQILDISDPASPALVGSYDTPGYALRLTISGSNAYIADYEGGLQIVNISNPAAPALVGTYSAYVEPKAQSVRIAGMHAYVADWNNGLLIIDISNPAVPTLTASVDCRGDLLDVQVAGLYAYIATRTQDVELVDISNPAAPVWAQQYSMPGYGVGLAVVGSYIYSAQSFGGLHILHVTPPAFAAWVIDGTPGTDAIALDMVGSEYRATVNGAVTTRPANTVNTITINGYAGNDTITVGASVTLGVTIHGGAGDDTIAGGSGDNLIYGEDGNDSLSGRGGDDSLDGGAGNDLLDGGGGMNVLIAGGGVDVLVGAPTNITLSATSVAENLPADTVVGTLSATDPDTGEALAYTLVSGNGSADNGSFKIVGDQLKTRASFNYEAKNAYSIRMRVTDSSGLSFDKVFAITVTDVNETPTSLALSNATITEGAGVNATVGTLSATDPDANSTFSYTLVAGSGWADNAKFLITGNTLKAKSSFDFETKSSYTIRVRVTDAGGLYYEKAFAIKVTNVAESAMVLDGSAGNDTLAVTLSGTKLRLTRNGALVSERESALVSRVNINGLAGNDTISLATNVMVSALIYGGEGNDAITGGSGNDTIYGNFGDDVIRGGAGNDSILAGLGADWIDGQGGNDRVWGGDGCDTIYGGAGNDYIEGKGKADTLYGGDGNDTILGHAGSDLIYGDAGDDWIDVYDGPASTFRDKVYGGAGTDTVKRDLLDVVNEAEILA